MARVSYKCYENVEKLSFETLKPIFHCDAIPFALGTFASPNAKNTNMLVSLLCVDFIRVG